MIPPLLAAALIASAAMVTIPVSSQSLTRSSRVRTWSDRFRRAAMASG